MGKFLNTSAANYYLEELIKGTRERLIIISPFLKVNERIKQLIEDLDRMKIDIRIVYGKSELAPKELKWLRGLDFVRTSYCDNLHAKCYLNESSAIITSLNLYDFSQVNNHEMGVCFSRDEDESLYSDAYEESMRIIRVSEEVKLSAEVVDDESSLTKSKDSEDLLTSSKVAKALGLKTDEFMNKMKEAGYLNEVGGDLSLSEKGIALGAQHMTKGRFGAYFLWPSHIHNT